MQKFDQRLFKIWIAVTIGAACTLFLNFILVLLMLTIAGIPLAIFLYILPGTWIYLSGTFLTYALFRLIWDRIAPLALVIISAAPTLAAGFLIPMIANNGTDARIADLMAQDHGSPPKIPRRSSITYALDGNLGTLEKCSDLCQRLLFSETATSFTQVSLDELPSLAALSKTAHRFSLGEVNGSCNNSRLQASYASPKEAGGALPPPYLWNKLPKLGREGLCLHADPVRDAQSQVLVVENRNYTQQRRAFDFTGEGWSLTLHPIAPFTRTEIYQRTPNGLSRKMRRTATRYVHLATPLWLVPGFTFDTSTPTHWAWTDYRPAESVYKIYDPTKWNGIIENDLTIHGLR